MNVRIRFPESLKERVQSFADADRRSLNSEVLTLLEEAMNAREPKRPPTEAFSYPDPSEHRATGRLMRAAEQPAP